MSISGFREVDDVPVDVGQSARSMPTLTLSHWLSLHGLITVAGLLVYAVASHVLHQRRHPSAAIGWVLSILLIPYVALPLYLLVGSRKLARTSHPATVKSSEQRDQNRLAEITAALGQPPPVPYRALTIHTDGSQALRALFAIVGGAQHTLDVCTFILARDTVGAAVVARLAERARAGVRVRLLVDGVGRILSGWADVSELTLAGGQVELFVPPWCSPLQGRTNLRNHRKLVLADAGHGSEKLWCGGRNLAAEYFEGQVGRVPWHDLSFDLGGPLTRQAAALFERDWAFAVGTDASALGASWLPQAEAEAAFQSVAQVVASGPDQADDTVYTLLISAAYRASTRIALSSPYVVLDDSLLMALSMAARRGVQVDLLLPERSNHRLADIARHRSLRTLANAGVNVWLAPEMLHAKAVVIDNMLALAGSANLDGRSLFLNYELMVAFFDSNDVRRFGTWFDLEMGSAVRYVSKPPGLLRDFAEGLILWIAFQL